MNSHVAVLEGLAFFESYKEYEKSDRFVVARNDTASCGQVYAITGQTGRVNGAARLRADCGGDSLELC